MNEQHALLYREPGPDGFRTHLLATGEWAKMQARWIDSDRRLRAGELGGHVIVRAVDDPIVPARVSRAWASVLYDPIPSPRAGDTYAKHSTDVGWTITAKGYRYWATCTCGYVGPVRVNPNDASNMGEDHAARAFFRRTGRWEE